MSTPVTRAPVFAAGIAVCPAPHATSSKRIPRSIRQPARIFAAPGFMYAENAA